MKRFSGFTIISGLGWILDFTILTSLVQLNVPVFWANLAGAFCAVTLVYVLAVRHVFERLNSAAPWKLLVAYWLWQVVAISLASALIALLTAAIVTQFVDMMPVMGLQQKTAAAFVAKVAVTPLTLVANFLFMRFLLESKRFQKC